MQGSLMIADIDKMTAMSIQFYVLVDVTEGRRDFCVVPGDKLCAGQGPGKVVTVSDLWGLE
ncbi:hypothetical protein ACLQ23_17980 [Micromonospora sp. DT41]